MPDTHIHLTEEFKENFNGVFKVIKDNTESTSLHSLIGEETKKFTPILAQAIKSKREPTEFLELFAQNRYFFFDNVQLDPFSFKRLDYNLRKLRSKRNNILN